MVYFFDQLVYLVTLQLQWSELLAENLIAVGPVKFTVALSGTIRRIFLFPQLCTMSGRILVTPLNQVFRSVVIRFGKLERFSHSLLEILLIAYNGWLTELVTLTLGVPPQVTTLAATLLAGGRETVCVAKYVVYVVLLLLKVFH